MQWPPESGSVIIHGNCLEVLPELPSETFDLCCCDPPYNISNEVVISRGSQGKYKGNDITSDFGCLLPDELVHTANGIKKMQDIQIGDMVIGLDGDLHKVSNMHVYDYDGDLIGFQTQSMRDKIYFTPNHRIPIGRKNEFWRGIFFERADRVKLGDYTVMPRCLIVKDVESLEMVYQPKTHRYHYVNRHIIVDGDFLRLLGYWYAEGSCGNNFITITFATHETEFIADCVALLEKVFGKKPNIYPHKEAAAVKIRLSSVVVVDFFRQEFYEQGDRRKKYIPNWILFLPPEKQEQFIRGWWRGDASENELRQELATKHAQHAFANQFILMRLGFYPAVSIKQKHLHGRDYSSYRIGMTSRNDEHISFKHSKNYTGGKRAKSLIPKSENAFYLPIRKIVNEYYCGKVYDLEVEDAHTYVTRAFCVHNSWDFYESPAEYERFTEIWCKECFRVLKPGGFLISFFDKRKLSLIPDILEPLGMKTRDIVTWIKRNPVPQVRKVKFAQASEMAIVMSKPGPNRFQWQNGYHPNYIKLPIVGGHQRLKDEEGKTLHMTQKPLMLFRWLIDYFCEPWGMVLDPFAGTCTTAAAAIMSGRRFTCIEKEKKYIHAGTERIKLIQGSFFPMDYKSKEYKLKYL